MPCDIAFSVFFRQTIYSQVSKIQTPLAGPLPSVHIHIKMSVLGENQIKGMTKAPTLGIRFTEEFIL